MTSPLAHRVTIFAPLTRDQCPVIPAQIVWEGSGPTTANEAKHMANALLDAAAACDKLNADAEVMT